MSDQVESKQQELQVLKELQQASGGLADRLEGLVDRVRALKESSSVSVDVLGRWRELFRVAGLRESLELVLVKTLAAQQHREEIKIAALSQAQSEASGGGSAAAASTAGSGPKAVGERPAKRRR